MPMPQDAHGRSIQVLAPGTSVVLSPNNDSVSSEISSPSGVLYISASSNVWIKFGVGAPTASADAGSIYIPGGVAFFALPSISGETATHIAAFAADAQTVCVVPLT